MLLSKTAPILSTIEWDLKSKKLRIALLPQLHFQS
jgi:hypothetical protein